ncbi:MAG: nucleotide exchange factor GrpE [Ruminococcaceae bacterium]|nr:nucleotide exchange factor GrpE [Oscillospiraceae bacterium]
MADNKQTEEKENLQQDVAEEAAAEAIEEETQNEFEKKYNDVNEKYMRTLAEYDNYRKRTIKEKESIYPEAKAVVVEKFLPLMDNFSRAIESAENKDAFYDGVVMLKKQMDEVFATLEVEEIESVGQQFNPELHNAVMHVDDEEQGENVIVEEFQKGYKIGERVIRHSMVKVAN